MTKYIGPIEALYRPLVRAATPTRFTVRFLAVILKLLFQNYYAIFNL